ncbi:alpha/beta hydrolase [Thiofilum flexile]|uniref:alpha/beta hydrolase n=1 Tax=Thiofilum flexile TaxID=125627 RepID=UPI000360F024|nr:alpha/beta fold hydrolase [Thiofilum flexile]
MSLEVLERSAAASDSAVPILFVHGILSGAWIWDEYFMPWFAKRGFHPFAVSLRGHGNSPAGKPLDQLALHDFVADVRQTVLRIQQSTGREPILVGHSMGGMVVQRYLSEYQAPAAVLMCSLPPQGMMPLSISSTLTNPLLAMQMAKVYSFPEMADTSFARDILFYHPAEETDLARWFATPQRESMRLLWDLNMALPLVSRVMKTPLSVVGARHDRLVPTGIVQWTASTYRCQLDWVNAGHAVMLEQNWQETAQVLQNSVQGLLVA